MDQIKKYRHSIQNDSNAIYDASINNYYSMNSKDSNDSINRVEKISNEKCHEKQSNEKYN